MSVLWPQTAEDLTLLQHELGRAGAEPWSPPADSERLAIGGCFVCFEPRPGGAGERGWAAAAVAAGCSQAGPPACTIARAVVRGRAGHPYQAGLLALREGPLLKAAVRGLATAPEVLLVNATGRDHPRRAGLAVHLGRVLGLPTVGVTHRPLLARGAWPGNERGARGPLRIGGETVGYWLRIEHGVRPPAVGAGWRTEVDVACQVVLAAARGVRAPAPIREARRLARTARAHEPPDRRRWD